MHPYWIQQIEESRRASVTTFWAVVFLVVVLPVILVMKVDIFIVFGICCFAVAGLRAISQGKSEMALRAEAAQAKMKAKAAPEGGLHMPAATPSTQWQSPQTQTFPGPQLTSGVQPMPDFATSQSKNGVPTDAFGQFGQPGMPQTAAPAPVAYAPATETHQNVTPNAFYTDENSPGQPLTQAPQSLSSQQETGPMPTSLPGQHHPDHTRQRPMHFHDLARH